MKAWDFVLRLYGGDGVEPACLALQDEHGQCVPLLLWRAWTLAEDRPVDDAALASAVATARTWHAEVIEPLRTVRRRLKAPLPPVDDAARLAFRQEVAAREMTAERLLIDTLEASTAEPGHAASPPIAGLRRTVEAWSGSAPDSLLTKLIPQ
ncbi:MAG TPA: TIGR02444 family protein [Caulobacteraceae bacterium]|jgi:uncharacterized protein (TIGR02444 family)|nr:TIGR02444 family protein [Caulobacteraceae bacterium]